MQAQRCELVLRRWKTLWRWYLSTLADPAMDFKGAMVTSDDGPGSEAPRTESTDGVLGEGNKPLPSASESGEHCPPAVSEAEPRPLNSFFPYSSTQDSLFWHFNDVSHFAFGRLVVLMSHKSLGFFFEKQIELCKIREYDTFIVNHSRECMWMTFCGFNSCTSNTNIGLIFTFYTLQNSKHTFKIDII